MDLGIQGRKAIVCGSSRGLGKACAQALAQEGLWVIINGRDAESVERTVTEINAAHPGQAIGVVGDVTTDDGRAAVLAACEAPDILINNSAGPSPKNFADTNPGDWAAAAGGSMIAPLLLTQAVLPAMIEQRFGRIVNTPPRW